MTQPESVDRGRRGPLRDGAEGAGPDLWGGSGTGLAGGKGWAWVGSGGCWSSRTRRVSSWDQFGV